MKTIFTLFFLGCVFLSFSESPGQINWDTEPSVGFVYQISNKEAKKWLLHEKHDSLVYTMLHTRIDTFDVKEGWLDRPEKGHFILTSVIGNKLHCVYTSVMPYQVFLMNEYDALALQVMDMDGNIREDAKVKIGWRRLGLDFESNMYRIESRWVMGHERIVTVELDDFTSVFKIVKHDAPRGYENYNYDEGPSFYSYMITDKNRYKPNETIRFKSYALSARKFLLRKDLELWIRNNSGYKKIGTVSPHRPGSYAGEFQLHDSLGLTLDKHYQIQLRLNDLVVASCNFKYEDYELNGVKLDVSLSNDIQYAPEANRISILATDENDLILKGATAEICIKMNGFRDIFKPLVILPDTLLFQKIDLKSDGPTFFDIPAALFGNSNVSYQVDVAVLNSQNQRVEWTTQAVFNYSKYEYRAELSNDSICFSMLENNVPMEGKNILFRSSLDKEFQEIRMPHKEKLNPAIHWYEFKNELLSDKILLRHLNPKPEIVGGVEKDSLILALSNPHQLEVSWFVYKGNELLQKGSGNEMEFKSLIFDRLKTWYAEMHYSFGGENFVKRYKYEFNEDRLYVSLDIPERIFPGQKVDATITVTDQYGDPVKNVDLTALAVTGKLGYYLPDLPYYGSTSSPRSKGATFNKSQIVTQSADPDLKYPEWEKMLRLDTMKFYQFAYPGNDFFRYSVPCEDSTQFAVYLMENGKAVEINVLELNQKPVYFSWTDQPSEYAFYVVPDVYNSISLRIWDRILMLDSVKFERGRKTILSFDIDRLPESIRIKEFESRLSGIEIDRYTALISNFVTDYKIYSFLEEGDEFIPLANNSMRYNRSGIKVGPVAPGLKTYSNSIGLSTTYRHQGGIKYVFEGNVVYKLCDVDLMPKYLYKKYVNPMATINDKVMTRERFIESQKNNHEEFPWDPLIVSMVDPNNHLTIYLPDDVDSTGITDVLFMDIPTGKVSPVCVFGDKSMVESLPEGLNTLMILYDNGTYFRMDSLNLKPDTHIGIRFEDFNRHEMDLISDTLRQKGYSLKACEFYYEPYKEEQQIHESVYYLNNKWGNVNGIVYSAEDGEPLPGVCIVIKDTKRGTISNVDGEFSLNIDDNYATIVVSYVGFVSEEVHVRRGSDISVSLQPDILRLSEIVVIGYGTQMRSSLCGAVSGVRINNYTPPAAPDEMEDPEEETEVTERQLYQTLMSMHTIRSNFSDVGFWEPRLYTDKNGQAHFTTTFPDDITRWDAVVYAMNRRLQTGTGRRSIRSYKPIMAELFVPQFLTQGDSAVLLGKVSNFTSDSTIQGKSQWQQGDQSSENEIELSDFHTDDIPVTVQSVDSIPVRYTFTRDDGYFDGEERTIPVVEQGIVRAEGTLSILKNGDTLRVKASGTEPVIVEILDNQLDVFMGDVNYLLNYRYACNEQLASKLIGLINYKIYIEAQQKSFKYDNDVKKIIKRLLKNQNKEFLWSWWDMSNNTSYWMSSHILRALKYAKDAGYEVKLDLENLKRKVMYKIEFLEKLSIQDADLFNALATWNIELPYNHIIYKLDSMIQKKEDEEIRPFSVRYTYFKEKLLLLETRQLTGLEYDRNTLLKYKKEGVLGEVFFDDNKRSRYWYEGNLIVNSIAYRIIKRDSLLEDMVTPMQLYFLSERKGHWNTYQSSNVLMGLLSDLVDDGYVKGNAAIVHMEGKASGVFGKFPFRIELLPGEELFIRKESGLPLYCQQYIYERVTEAKTGVEGFTISTRFDDDDQILESGTPVDLVVDIKVLKDKALENVMIEIPIPGSCSYYDKSQPRYWSGESHREYFKEKTVVFCDKLIPGKHRFIVKLLPRFSGKYFLNPSEVSLMYVPVVNANTEIKKVYVED